MNSLPSNHYLNWFHQYNGLKCGFQGLIHGEFLRRNEGTEKSSLFPVTGKMHCVIYQDQDICQDTFKDPILNVNRFIIHTSFLALS